ncbi:MAG: tRNA preQ1(34) S-adenosylmethionine ribosyltransferase-isomerase QueA [Patescibacteria group bacterium]
MLSSDFDYHLPPELIGQKPIRPRDQARLLILEKKEKKISHQHFFDLVKILLPGDVLVLNNSKVIPARLVGEKENGAKREIFLLQKKSVTLWQCLIRGKVKVGDKIFLTSRIWGEVLQKDDEDKQLVKFNTSDKKIFLLGQTPTPPYIKKPAKLADYQTVYASSAGSVAAPTAGLHFTKKLLKQLKAKGVAVEYITLHVGLGTFLPVKAENILDHQMHQELAIIEAATARRLNQAKKAGRRVIAVGTTSVRTLEALADKKGQIKAQKTWVNIFIYPGYRFRFVDGIITNFHLPKSTLLMLVSAFAGLPEVKRAYQEAINCGYCFYSFGDAMLVV